MSPTQKLRPRYIAFKFKDKVSEGEFNEFLSGLSQKISLPNPRPRIVLYSNDANCGLIKCNHLQAGELKEELKKINKVGRKPIEIEVLGVSGTIRTAKRKFLPV